MLQEEVAARNAVVGDKEARIYELKVKVWACVVGAVGTVGPCHALITLMKTLYTLQVQELEKHRFVLEFRAKELKEALEPQQHANAQLQKDNQAWHWLPLCLCNAEYTASYLFPSSVNATLAATCRLPPPHPRPTPTGAGGDQHTAAAQDAGAGGGRAQWPSQAARPEAGARGLQAAALARDAPPARA